MTRNEILENLASYLAWKTEWERNGMRPADMIEKVRREGGDTHGDALKVVVEEMEAFLRTL